MSVREGNLVEELTRRENVARQGDWVAACGRTEVPFRTRKGRTLLYCWQSTTGDHAYLDTTTDLILSQSESEAALGFFE